MIPTRTDLKIAAITYEKIISLELSGGIKRSTILPCILEPKIEEEVFAKAFCIMVITIIPGAKKLI